MTRPTIYVAGAVAEVQRAAGVIAQLRELGFTITHDWTAQVLAAPDRHERDMETTERQLIALQSMRGAREAGLLILLIPAEGRGRGAWVEFGYALHACVRLITCGDASCSVFTELAERNFATDAEALAWLRGRYEVAA